jgi:hypothetical protein
MGCVHFRAEAAQVLRLTLGRRLQQCLLSCLLCCLQNRLQAHLIFARLWL